jgi:Bax protein
MGFVAFFLAGLSALTGFPGHWLKAAPPPSAPVLVADTADLDGLFQQLDYRLDAVRAGAAVPPVMLGRLPDDWPGDDGLERRKSRFIRIVLPLVLRANARVLADRRRLLGLLNATALPPAERTWLAGRARRYDVAEGDYETLVHRIDAVPPALIIAQAAVESAWGTSRFARHGNALFGQWTTEGGGLVPKQRRRGAEHEVKSFPTLGRAVDSYLKNLNTHGAYRTFRAMRTAMRNKGLPLDSQTLAAGLALYSEQGVAYVRTLRTVIGKNRLEALNGARLARR